MQITIYTTTTCPYCNQLKEFLKGKNIAFEERLVDQDDKAREEMLTVSAGFQGVPFTVIKKDGETETVVGFDKDKIAGILGLGA